jgi:hypothetical protein
MSDYLRLSAVADSPEAANGILLRLVREGKIHPLRWCKTYLYAKPDLDRFVMEQIDQLGQRRECDSSSVTAEDDDASPILCSVEPKRRVG